MSRLTITRHLEVARSRAEVFRYLADFSTSEQWDPGVRSAVKRTPGAPRAGSTFDLVLALGPASVPMTYELVALRPSEHIALAGRGQGFSADDRIDLADCACGTRITYEAQLDLRWAPRALRPLLARWGDRLGDHAMQGLAAALTADGARTLAGAERLAQRLVLPGAIAFTAAGYRRLPSRGLSRFMDGKRVGITGATRGLGLAAAQLLARLGADLLLVGRGRASLDAARCAIEDFAGPTAIECLEADLSSLAQTRAVADAVVAQAAPLDAWINNAGGLYAHREETAEGIERSLSVNLLSPALLGLALAPKLAARNGRIINVVSGGLYLQGVDLDDLEFRTRRFDGTRAYAQAKRALLALTRRWAHQPSLSGAIWHAMHPGWADTPGVRRSLPAFHRVTGPWLRNPRMGADTMAWLASHPDAGEPARSGAFWFDRAERPVALLPGTAMDEAGVSRLERWVCERIGS